MVNRSVDVAGGRVVRPALLTELRGDLKRKQELLSAACRCLEHEPSYRFFCHLSAMSEMASAQREDLLDQLEAVGAYRDYEMEAIRRLVQNDGAAAFKDLVDLVRDIRIEQEIEAMVG